MGKRGKLSWRAFRNSLITASLVLSAVVCFGILSKTQNAHAQAKEQPATLKLEEKEEIFGGKEKEREKVKIPEIEPEIHRRILRFLNAAQRPEDLMFPPQNELRVIEEMDELHHLGGHAEH